MDRHYSIDFGALLKSLRTERKISQQGLADVAGVERNYIYYLESGKSDPTLRVLLGLAAGLGLSFSQFASKIEQMPSITTAQSKHKKTEK